MDIQNSRGPPTEEGGSVVLAWITTEETNNLNLETWVEKFWETEYKADKSPVPYMYEEDKRGEETLVFNQNRRRSLWSSLNVGHSPELVKWLFDWYNGLATLEGIRLSRGLRSKHISKVREQRYLVFTGASSTGFGVVIYQCKYYNDESVEVSFAVSKTRVTPLKQRTIPELELEGACGGVD